MAYTGTMIDKKHLVPTKLLWVDLEMTGLDASNDLILEIAAEITDFDFKPLASYEARIKQPRDKVLERMQLNTWWESYPVNRDDFLDNLAEARSTDVVESDLVALVKAHFGDEPVILAGNSIHADRGFIDSHWPTLARMLHYRMLDVTSWKVVMQGKYGQEFTKKETHRAFDDIHESIDELKSYLEHIKR